MNHDNICTTIKELLENALACAYQQKGDEHRARDYFDQAKRYCDEVNHE